MTKKNILINYLLSRAGEEIRREEIIQNTQISKSRLSELINVLRADGYEISTPNRSGKVKIDSNTTIAKNITPKEIRQWLIILSLSKLGKATYIELICSLLSIADSTYLYEKITTDEKYSDMDILNYLEKTNRIAKDDIDTFLSLPTLRKDLHELIENGFITQQRIPYKNNTHVVYFLSEKSPLILFESEDEIYDFMIFYDNFKSSLSNTTPLDSLYKKITYIYDWESYESSTYIYGKLNQINPMHLDYLSKFIQYSYKSKSLFIEYRGKEKKLNFTIDSGLLFYSIETNCFYLLCINTSNKEIMQLKVDHILSIRESPTENDHYKSAQFMNIYQEMFSTSYEPQKTHVKILFQDFGNIRERICSLHRKRKNSKLYDIEPININIPHTIVYEDDIRGISAFSRYLRSFGSSALVLEPFDLRELMINSCKKIISNYEVTPNEK